jgi:hypothetical protein
VDLVEAEDTVERRSVSHYPRLDLPHKDNEKKAPRGTAAKHLVKELRRALVPVEIADHDVSAMS